MLFHFLGAPIVRVHNIFHVHYSSNKQRAKLSLHLGYKQKFSWNIFQSRKLVWDSLGESGEGHMTAWLPYLSLWPRIRAEERLTTRANQRVEFFTMANEILRICWRFGLVEGLGEDTPCFFVTQLLSAFSSDIQATDRNDTSTSINDQKLVKTEQQFRIRRLASKWANSV